MTDPLPDEQPPGFSRHRADLLTQLEAVVVVVAAPFLFFPTFSLIGTLAALVALVVVWLLPPLLQRRAGLPSTLFNVALILWGLVLIVAILVSADPEQTLPKAAGVILGLAVWRLLVKLGYQRSNVGFGLLGYIVLGSVMAIVGAFGLDDILKIPVLVQFSPSRLFTLPKSYGLSTHPNQLAGLICLLLPLLVSLLVGWKSVSRHSAVMRTALLLLTLLITGILLFTQSRGGWIGVAGGIFVLLLSWALIMPPSPIRKFVRAAALVSVVAALAAAILIGPDQLQQFWQDPPAETAIGTFTTLNYRKELWPWALTAVGDFAFTGTGLGSFREVAFRLYPVQLSPDADIGHAHNIFLQTALDVGLPGLVVYVALLLLALGGAWSVARHDAGLRAAALGLLAGLAALHIYGLADALALGSKPGLLFWYALGLIGAMTLVAAAGRADRSLS